MDAFSSLSSSDYCKGGARVLHVCRGVNDLSIKLRLMETLCTVSPRTQYQGAKCGCQRCNGSLWEAEGISWTTSCNFVWHKSTSYTQPLFWPEIHRQRVKWLPLPSKAMWIWWKGGIRVFVAYQGVLVVPQWHLSVFSFFFQFDRWKIHPTDGVKGASFVKTKKKEGCK